MVTRPGEKRGRIRRPPAATASRKPPVVRSSQDGERLVEAARTAWSVAIRVGAKPHRFIRIWAVVVDGRIYARSWSLSPRGWYRRLVTDRQGVVQVGGRSAPFRAVRARGEALKGAVDRAYLAKYPRPGEAHYARDLCRPASRSSTMELRLGPVPRER